MFPTNPSILQYTNIPVFSGKSVFCYFVENIIYYILKTMGLINDGIVVIFARELLGKSNQENETNQQR